jgi:O-acetyl-ADP-ribose deacetylase (regulator of RNase III)
MPLSYHTGDICNSGADVIAHGCNCFNTMGSGVARALRAKWPRIYTTDKATVYGSKEKLGSFSVSTTPEGPTLFNLYSQYRYGTDQIQLDYMALANALQKMNDWLNAVDPDKKLTVALPRIGCGFAGGDWNRVRPMIESAFGRRTIQIWSL